MDEQVIDFEAVALGLKPFLFDLAVSRLADRREALMAATPKLWGLFVWVNGGTYIFLDEKGYVCSTTDASLIVPLCMYESSLGTGALRTLLQRPILDPTMAIEYIASKVIQKKREEEIKTNLKPPGPVKRNRPLTTTAFKNLLEEL